MKESIPLYMYMCVGVCMCVFVHVCMYLYFTFSLPIHPLTNTYVFFHVLDNLNNAAMNLGFQGQGSS